MKKKGRILVGIGSTLLLGILAVGGYIAYQYHKGMEMAQEYAQKALEYNLPKDTSDKPSSSGNQPQNSEMASPSETASQTPGDSTQKPAGSPSSNGEYKKLMTDTYQTVLQTMENVKANTYSLQSGKISLSSYKSSIRSSQSAFSQALNYTQSHPPEDSALNNAYQEFTSAISLSNDAMSVVLNGISSLNPSSLFAAKEMGSTAKDRLVNSYNQF